MIVWQPGYSASAIGIRIPTRTEHPPFKALQANAYTKAGSIEIRRGLVRELL